MGLRASYPAPELPPGPRSALVVATARYTDAALQQLRAPSRDAAELSAVLGDPDIGCFEVTQLIDESSYGLRVGIERYLVGRGSDDLLVVYLSCHGVLDRRGRLYFAATDTDPTMLSSTGVAASWLLDQLDECRAAQQVVILDCCFSGAFDPRSKGGNELDLDRLTGSGRGRAVLTASRHYEYSFEGDAFGGEPTPSLFTAGLIDGLARGAADPVHKGFISVDDAYDYAYRYVQDHGAQQTPQRWLYGAEGKIWLARNPAGRVVTPADLPDDLRHALESRYPVMRLGAVEILAEWLVDTDPARQLTATAELREIAESDIPRVAEAARRALQDGHADPGQRHPVGEAVALGSPTAPVVPAETVVPEAAPESGAEVEPAEPDMSEREPTKPSAEPMRTEPPPEDLAATSGRAEPDRPAPPPAERVGWRPLVRSINAHRVMAAVVTATMLVAGIVPVLLNRRGSPAKTPPGSGVAGDPTSVANVSTRAGGTLRMAAEAKADSFDPARSYNVWIWNFQRSFFARTLLTYAAKPGVPTLVPDLATAMPSVSDNGRKYTLHLKSGLKFETGAPIRSSDIKYGIERNFATDLFLGGPTYLVNALDNGQRYPGPYKDPDARHLGLKSIQTPDDNTIVFTLSRPTFEFPHYLAMPQAAPVPAAKDTGIKYERRPVSSGPYRFSTDTNAATVRMVRNKAWVPATDQVRKALPEAIELTTGKAAADIDQALLAGQLDIDAGQSGVQTATRTRILADPDLMRNATSLPLGVMRHFAVNTKVEPFDDVHCRRAVQYAVDRTALRAAMGGPPAADIVTSMLPPWVPGYDAGRDPYGTRDGAQVVSAKGELAKCGHPNGFQTKILTADSGFRPKIAAALQTDLAKVGIKATIEQQDRNAYSQTARSPSDLNGKSYGLISAAWVSDFPTASGVFQIADGRLITPYSNFNIAQLNDRAVNDLLDRLTAATDAQSATRLAAQLDNKIMETATYVPYATERAVSFHSARLTNVLVNSAYGMTDFSSLGVA